MNNFKIITAETSDIPTLYNLQLITFESEAEMIGSREVPALQESKQHFTNDFKNWITLKLIDESNKIIGAIRFREINNIIEIARLMVHPNFRRKGLAQRLLLEIDNRFPNNRKELYTCTKSWINIKLYEKTGFKTFKEVTEESGLTFVYMFK